MIITINNKKVKVAEGMTVLDAARSAGIEIPTLCSQDALAPYGACRLCIVEIEKDGKTFVESSCSYPVEEGLVVKTGSESVLKGRRFVIELLLARSPNVKRIRELAREYQVEDIPRQWNKDNEYCILCGLCVRVCQERMGIGAISFAHPPSTAFVFLSQYAYCTTCVHPFAPGTGRSLPLFTIVEAPFT